MGNETELPDEVVVSGSSVEEAVKRALLQLNVSLDEVDVEVIATGSRGLLGLGGEDARVRVRLRDRPYLGEADVDTDDEEDVAPVASNLAQVPETNSAAEIESSDAAEEREGRSLQNLLFYCTFFPQIHKSVLRSTVFYIGLRILSCDECIFQHIETFFLCELSPKQVEEMYEDLYVNTFPCDIRDSVIKISIITPSKI